MKGKEHLSTIVCGQSGIYEAHDIGIREGTFHWLRLWGPGDETRSRHGVCTLSVGGAKLLSQSIL